MSLEGTYDHDNVFAKILRGDLPCHRIYEDEVALSFLDLFPQARGHTLVLPKDVTARTILDVPADRIGPWMERVQRTALAVRRALQPDGITIMQFNGEAGGQTVFHPHVHVIPRSAGAGLAGHGAAGKADEDELKSLAAQIAAAF